MASGDIVYELDACDVYSVSGDNNNSFEWLGHLNKGGTTAGTRANVTFEQHATSPVDPPLDMTKQYDVIIKEH
jgi:hypothetical protein